MLPEEKGPAIIGFSELDEAIAVQKLPLGAKESDIVLPDTLEVEVEEADERLAEDSQNVHLVETANKGTEKDTDAETAVWQISGITWKLTKSRVTFGVSHFRKKTISRNLTKTESLSKPPIRLEWLL